MTDSSQGGATTTAEESQETETQASVALDDSLMENLETNDDDHDRVKAPGPGKKRTKGSPQKTKKEEPKIVTERDNVERRPPLSARDGGTSFKVLCWNVNSIRATVKKGLGVMRQMVKDERPDLICFQETKIQEKDVELLRDQNILPGYSSVWSCSTVKKGYAGTAVFYPESAAPVPMDVRRGESEASGPPTKKRKQGKISSFFSNKDGKGAKEASPVAADATDTKGEETPVERLPGGQSGLKILDIRYGIGKAAHEGEGRAITIEYDKFFVVNLYVPNSGQKLERLSYRTQKWDVDLREYVEKLEAEGKPVIICGDLNVGHLDLDIYNVGAKHLPKSAGTTKEERESFDSWLKGGKIVDAFRRLHPNSRGAYTYWSVRTNARPANKGLRLDYILCSASLFDQEKASGRKAKGKKAGGRAASSAGAVTLHDCFHLHAATVGLSDHCPVGVTLRVS